MTEMTLEEAMEIVKELGMAEEVAKLDIGQKVFVTGSGICTVKADLGGGAYQLVTIDGEVIEAVWE